MSRRLGPTLAYQVVDVFTSTAFAGNPLAVVLDADDLSTAQLQVLANEFNLSETAFPTAPPQGASYGVRIFTPATELPFAGHPSIGTAWVLHDLGRIDGGANVQSCGAGLLQIDVSHEAVTLTGGTPSVSEPLDSQPFLEALGLSPEDLAGTAPRWAGVGLDFGFLMVRQDALSRVHPDHQRVAALGRSGVSVLSWDGAVATARVFAGGVGVGEDAATGSAALGLGVFLAASDLLGDGQHSYVVEQGVEMGRPSTLTCGVVVEAGAAVQATVSGTVVPIARGEIRVPLEA